MLTPKPVARVGDLFATGHACAPVSSILLGSKTVFIDNRPAARVGDPSVVHPILVGEACVPHQVLILTGSPTVFVEGKPLARVGDQIDFGAITTGAPTVFSG